nr:hypothetical protein [uncultured Acinetobacter sp.]
MNEPSKLMCQLATVSRGLDVEHPEFKRKSRADLAVKLRKAITSVSHLEKQEFDQSICLHTIKDCAIGLLDQIGKGAELDTLKLYALEILNTVEEQ